MIIFTDGAARGNPGPASYAFVVFDDHHRLIHEEGQYIGHSTNNVAEYTAVAKALSWVEKHIGKDFAGEVVVNMDSLLVVKQLTGLYKVKNPHLKVIFDQVKIKELQLGRVFYRHIRREGNSYADRLANIALDNR